MKTKLVKTVHNKFCSKYEDNANYHYTSHE